MQAREMYESVLESGFEIRLRSLCSLRGIGNVLWERKDINYHNPAIGIEAYTGRECKACAV